MELLESNSRCEIGQHYLKLLANVSETIQSSRRYFHAFSVARKKKQSERSVNANVFQGEKNTFHVGTLNNQEKHTWSGTSLWRNRLARSAVNRKVGGSSPPRDELNFFPLRRMSFGWFVKFGHLNSARRVSCQDGRAV